MKHASTQALFDYWNQQRGRRWAPIRSDIDPADIRHVLGDIFMVVSDFAGDIRFRLAGTRVCALFAREIISDQAEISEEDKDALSIGHRGGRRAVIEGVLGFAPCSMSKID